jgi:predicted transcriptional regulator
MPYVQRLWKAIPVGQDRAESATEIWRRYDLGARSSLQHKLNRLAAEGNIKRISRPMPQGGQMHLYYRSPD